MVVDTLKRNDSTPTAVVIQPCFFPWRGQIDLISRADITVFLDTVQYSPRSWYNRNRVVSSNGLCWLTVPVLTKGHRETTIRDIRISNEKPWRRKILSTLTHAYGKTPGYPLYFESLAELLGDNWNFLADVACASVSWSFQHLDRKPTFIRSSEMTISTTDPVERLIEICKTVGAKRYLSGPSAKDYIAAAIPFEKEGLELEWMEYEYPLYPQRIHSDVPLSILDLLFNTGDEAASYIWT